MVPIVSTIERFHCTCSIYTSPTFVAGTLSPSPNNILQSRQPTHLAAASPVSPSPSALGWQLTWAPLGWRWEWEGSPPARPHLHRTNCPCRLKPVSSTKGAGRELALLEWAATKGLLERNQVVPFAPRPLPNTCLVPFLPSSALCTWKKYLQCQSPHRSIRGDQGPTCMPCYKAPEIPICARQCRVNADLNWILNKWVRRKIYF